MIITKRIRIGYYNERGRYVPEYAPTIHPLMLFIGKLEAELALMTPEEKQLLIYRELRGKPAIARPKEPKGKRGIQQLKPTFEEFMEQYNRSKEAA